MKQIVPFTKDIVFDDEIANIVSISLEHDFKIDNNEVVGEFLVIGEYKKNDSTMIFDFEEHIPFNLLIPEELDCDTLSIDVDDFTYGTNSDNSIKVNIDLSLFGEDKKVDTVRDLEDIWGLTNDIEVSQDNDNSNVNVSDNVIEENNTNINIENNIEINNEIVNEVGEYIIYHIHIVKENESIENIVNQYNTNIEILKEYNDISNLKIGDKLIIPEIYYGNN